jgi:hypothetical protein
MPVTWMMALGMGHPLAVLALVALAAIQKVNSTFGT